jgi:hypothetical protein
MRFSAGRRRVALLAVVALALGGYTYLTAPEKKAAGGPQEETALRRILDFDPGRVTKVEISYEGESLICQRTTEGWKVEPGIKALRAGAAEDFLESIGQLVEIGEVEEGAEGLSEYGLDHPTSRILLQIEGGGTRTILLGSHNPVQTSVYARVDNAPRVVLVGSLILWEMRKLFLAAGS